MNSNESIVAAFLQKRGHHVINRGWPDFLCVKREYNRITKSYTGNFTGVLAVEVKAGKDTLTDDQKTVHAILKIAGIPTYVIRPEEIDNAKNLSNGRLRLWTMDDVNSIRRKVNEMEWDLNRRQEELNKLKQLIEDTAVIFEETNYLLQEPTSENLNERA